MWRNILDTVVPKNKYGPDVIYVFRKIIETSYLSGQSLEQVSQRGLIRIIVEVTFAGTTHEFYYY